MKIIDEIRALCKQLDDIESALQRLDPEDVLQCAEYEASKVRILKSLERLIDREQHS